MKNAFLYGELDRDIFMKQPQGFVSHEFPNYVCRLKKTLYGLMQFSRAWFGKMVEYLSFYGLISSDSDPSLFIKVSSSMYTIILLYVDDMIITGNDDVEILSLRDELFIHFEMKNLGEVHSFLSLKVIKNDGYFIY